MLSPRVQPPRLTALGGSVDTPPEGITADLLIVRDFTELTNRAPEARAVGSLIGSPTPFSMQTPQTGMMRYEDGVPRIPHAALSVEDLLLLQQELTRSKIHGRACRIRVTSGCRFLRKGRHDKLDATFSLSQLRGGSAVRSAAGAVSPLSAGRRCASDRVGANGSELGWAAIDRCGEVLVPAVGHTRMHRAGGMGVVHKARQPKLERLVALKLMQSSKRCATERMSGPNSGT
jgi:hypothetical protein